MKVVFVSPYFAPRIGGLEIYLERLADGLTSTYGVDCRVICSAWSRHEPTEATWNTMRVRRFPFWFKVGSTPIGLNWARQVRSLLREDPPDLVSAHLPVPFLPDIAVREASKMGIPSAVTIHGLWNDGIVRSILGQLYVGVLGRETLRRARRIIANSRFVASSLIRQFPWLQDKTSVVYPGATFTPESDVRAREKDMPIVLLTASQLNRSARRGVEVLLAAFAGYAVIHPDSKLVVIGGGDDLPRLTGLASKLGILSKVHFVGEVPHNRMSEWYSRATLYVFPTSKRGEGLGLSLIEAQAAGLPVISTNTGGIREAVENGSTGILIPRLTSDNLLQALNDLTRDAEVRAQMGNRAETHARSRFDWSRTVQTTYEIYAACVSRTRARPLPTEERKLGHDA